MNWTKIMECVPNFSEGRDLQKIDEIVSPFRAKAGVKLLDYSNDEDHNRLVVTVVGEPDALKEAVIEAIGIAVELIDQPSPRTAPPYGSCRCSSIHSHQRMYHGRCYSGVQRSGTTGGLSI